MSPVVASLTPLLAIWVRSFERREMPGHGIESFANVVGIPRALPRPLGERLGHMGVQVVPQGAYDTVLRPNPVAFARSRGLPDSRAIAGGVAHRTCSSSSCRSRSTIAAI